MTIYLAFTLGVLTGAGLRWLLRWRGRHRRRRWENGSAWRQYQRQDGAPVDWDAMRRREP